jgi:hypothetical protein
MKRSLPQTGGRGNTFGKKYKPTGKIGVVFGEEGKFLCKK